MSANFLKQAEIPRFARNDNFFYKLHIRLHSFGVCATFIIKTKPGKNARPTFNPSLPFEQHDR